MANELSRVSDRLTRVRERTWSGAASLRLPPQGSREARHEPTRVPPTQEREQHARADAGAEKKRPPTPTTVVAIHVQVSQPNQPGAYEDNARVVEAQAADGTAAHQHQFAVEESAVRVEVNDAAGPVFASPALVSSPDTYDRDGRVSAAGHYLAAHAISAYLAQQTFSAADAQPQRLIDVRV